MSPTEETAPGWRRGYRDLDAVANARTNRAKREGSRGQLYVLEIPTAVIIGCVLGKLVDDNFDVAPIGIAVGLFAGVAYAVRTIFRIIRWYKTVDTDLSAPDDTNVRGPDGPT